VGAGASVAQVTEPHRKVSCRYRSHGVKDEPESLVAITVFSPDSITEIPHPEPAWLA
jgi:hypothetical protein